ncbi:tRNA dihydrouridine synthase DusB [candidate division KSB1 bacterium 4572_119]|nr:MAG: tRNA dihydrouridine synthase DusB [candidate division KSB1 bacterium 4572_119]
MIFGNMKLDGKVLLAPLAGVTDSSFRLICRELGATAVLTEMISADGLMRGNKRTREYMFFRKSERPIGFQLFGTDPEIFARAVDQVMEEQPDFIDLNFGCPVKKVTSRGAGSALMKDPAKIARIADAVVKKSPVPVFAKIRKGWDARSENAVKVAKELEQSGVQAIVIHPRTQAEQFKGHSDWSMIGKVKQAVSIPVIGNGDIRGGEDAQRMINETGCDLVMIGRGSLGNPWVFQQVNHFLKTGEKLQPPDLEEMFRIIVRHLDDKISLTGPRRAVYEMRKHISWYLRGLPGCAQMRAQLFDLTEVDEIKNKLKEFFSNIEN